VAGRRVLGFALAFLIEVLLLLVLLTLGSERPSGVEERRTKMVSIRAEEIPAEVPEESRPEPERKAEARPEQPSPPQPAPPAPVPPTPAPPAPQAIIPMRWSLAPPNPLRPIERPAPPTRPVYGPPDIRSAAMRDTERVGTAPNGEPLYAAEWYREPRADMMRAYLSGLRIASAKPNIREDRRCCAPCSPWRGSSGCGRRGAAGRCWWAPGSGSGSATR
jgi:protein TonB